MHSAYETAGAEDTELMVKALTRFFLSDIKAEGQGAYSLL
jgi:aspartyl aminopeptidase